MQKAWKVILIISIIINLALGFILLSRPKNKELNTSVYTEKIDSLETELLTIRENRDSVESLIDTVYIEINNIERNYEEARDVILSNSISDDYMFFTEYLEWNRNRLDSIANP